MVSKLMKKYRPTMLNSEVIRKGPVIFIGNHRHKLDQYFIVAATQRVIHWGAKEEYFNGTDSLFGKRMSCAYAFWSDDKDASSVSINGIYDEEFHTEKNYYHALKVIFKFLKC